MGTRFTSRGGKGCALTCLERLARLAAGGGLGLGVATGCKPVVLVSPYDAMIETRLQDYREELNTMVKRASAGQGTQSGTFDASKDTYAALEARVEGIVDRARLQDQGVGCKLDDATWTRIKDKLSKAAGLPASNPAAGDGSGCVVMMLINVQQNLADLKQIHADPNQCQSPTPDFPTCLRPAAAADILAISNQTIDAVLFVENELNQRKAGA